MERPNAWKNYTKTDLKKLETIAKEYKAHWKRPDT